MEEVFLRVTRHSYYRTVVLLECFTTNDALSYRRREVIRVPLFGIARQVDGDVVFFTGH